MNDLNIQRGNPYSATLTVTDTTVTPAVAYNLTGKTVFFTLKNLNDESADDTAAVIKKDITSHTNPTGGITTLSLSTVETLQPVGRYKCDIRIYNSGGVQLNSTRFYANIEDIVTKRIA
jgi:hypothetical protein